jgi:methionyl-tRNA synthetase
MANKFYITTAIDYVNAKPHIGHAYEKILTDVLARWNRFSGKDTFFLTGTDENAQKNAQVAKEKNIPTEKFVEDNSKHFEELCKTLNLSNDDFIKTTQERHVKVAQEIFQKIYDSGDIYKKSYAGNYCVGCEAFLTERDLVEGKCPEHNKKPELIEEENYFFKLSKYEDKILKLCSSDNFIVPAGFRKEIVNRIKSDGLKDISVSRPGLEWGIDTPIDKGHKIYVWIDALSNYISALGYPNGAKYKKYWPAEIHVVGKGINWFHSVIWPAILMSAKIPLPKQILVHGYVTFNGKKISKSLGNAIDPNDVVPKYGVDQFRYTMIKEVPFNQDGDFSENSLKDRTNNELANDLGNLLSRTLSLCEKYFDGKLTKQKDDDLFKRLNLEKIEKHISNYELHLALDEIWSFIRSANKYVNDNEPWKNEENREVVLYNLLESLRISSLLLSSFMPETSEKINAQLGIKLGNIKDVKFGIIDKYIVKKGDILFNKIE